MFIKYNGTNIHALGHLSTNSKMNQSPESVYWLRPGWNEFPSNVWKQYEKHPQIQKMLKQGAPDSAGKPTKNPMIELMTDKITVTKGKKKVTKVIGQDDEELSITLFDEKRAIQIVKSMFNRDILQRWDDEETRGKVRRAITKQLEPLLPTEENTKDDNDDEDDDAA